MSAEWYYTKDSQKHGPVSGSDLKAMAKSGELSPTDMVQKEGMAEWKVASSLKGLFQMATPVSSPPLPAPAAISPKLEATPEPPSIADAASPESGEAPDSLSFTDKLKGRLGKAIGPKGAEKLAVAKSFFKKNRLWFGVGTGVAACIILILFLLPAGTLPGGKKGYTQRILDLDPAKQKEYGVVVPKGAKTLYAPGSVEDFVHSLTMFKREPSDIAVTDTKNPNGGGREVIKVNESNGVHYAYQVQYLGGLFVKQECWDTIYGPRQQLKTVGESTGADPRFGGGRTLSMDHWSVPCGNEAVLVRGYNPKAPQAASAKKGEILLEFVHFNTSYQSICPGPGTSDSSVRRFSFHSFYKDK